MAPRLVAPTEPGGVRVHAGGARAHFRSDLRYTRFAYTGYRQCICPWFATVGMFDLPAADRVAGGALASGHGLSPYGDSSVSDPAGSGQAVWRWRSVDDASHTAGRCQVPAGIHPRLVRDRKG